MRFAVLAETFGRMQETGKRLELISHLVDLFGKTPPEVVARTIYLLQGKIRPDYEGVEPGVAEKMAMKAVAKSSGVSLREVDSKYKECGDLGVAASNILEAKSQTTFLAEEITVERVYDTLYRIARLEGSRSQNMKMKYVSSLLNDATPAEASFIVKILLGTMRLGVAENTIMDALAEAYTGGRTNRIHLEGAYNVSSDLGRVAETAAREGLEGINSFQVKPFSPVRPMLAERVRSEEDAAAEMAGGSAEYKLDGERMQIHTDGSRTEIYSRRLERITDQYPDVVDAMPEMIRARHAILEAEAVAVNPDTGVFLPFQELMHRRRKHGIEQAVSKYPVSVNFFDVLYADGRNCMDMPYTERRHILKGMVVEGAMARLIPATPVRDAASLMESMEGSVEAGGEGLMLKAAGSVYRAGSRGKQWLKLKREYQDSVGDSLDLVVVGAFYGKGRRTGIYGTFLLAAYDDEDDVFRSVCKVGTGFKDEDLDTMHQLLRDRTISRRDRRVDSTMEADVWFAPETVIEVVASEITLSPIHRAAIDVVRKDAGLALRFPKFTGRMRHDKLAEDASTTQEVVALYRGQKKTS